MVASSQHHDKLRFLVSSRLRLRILEALDTPMRLSDLRRVVGANAPNTSSKAKDLQFLRLIEREDGNYKITRAGVVVRSRIKLLLDTLDSLYTHWEFWEKMLEKIPDEMLFLVHEFREARFVKNTKENLDRVKEEVLRAIREAEEELEVVLPVRCKEIAQAVKNATGRVRVRMETLRENPELSYGLVKTKNRIILFTEMMDMALVVNPRGSYP